MKNFRMIVSVPFLLVAAGSSLASEMHVQEPMTYSGSVPDDMGIVGGVRDFLEKQSLNADRQGMISTKALRTNGPAGGLVYLQVTHVHSANASWESISEWQQSTSYDHGGPAITVVTDEIGYGSNPIARFNGRQLPSSSMIQQKPICANASSVSLGCSPGQTIVGYRRYWLITGSQSGLFGYQNTSTNSPWNTMSDSLTIR